MVGCSMALNPSINQRNASRTVIRMIPSGETATCDQHIGDIEFMNVLKSSVNVQMSSVQLGKRKSFIRQSTSDECGKVCLFNAVLISHSTHQSYWQAFHKLGSEIHQKELNMPSTPGNVQNLVQSHPLCINPRSS